MKRDVRRRLERILAPFCDGSFNGFTQTTKFCYSALPVDLLDELEKEFSGASNYVCEKCRTEFAVTAVPSPTHAVFCPVCQTCVQEPRLSVHEPNA